MLGGEKEWVREMDWEFCWVFELEKVRGNLFDKGRDLVEVNFVMN